jgi:hypothetical protein
MRVELPLSDGDEIFWVIAQVACGPEGEQEVQILYAEGSRAYPFHPGS